jgi:hypothetical protein
MVWLPRWTQADNPIIALTEENTILRRIEQSEPLLLAMLQPGAYSILEGGKIPLTSYSITLSVHEKDINPVVRIESVRLREMQCIGGNKLGRNALRYQAIISPIVGEGGFH